MRLWSCSKAGCGFGFGGRLGGFGLGARPAVRLRSGSSVLESGAGIVFPRRDPDCAIGTHSEPPGPHQGFSRKIVK